MGSISSVDARLNLKHGVWDSDSLSTTLLQVSLFLVFLLSLASHVR